MPKTGSSKTKKSAAKRFKLTGTGKIKTSSAGRRHLAKSKNRKRMRRLAKPKALAKADYEKILGCMPFAR